MTKLYKNFFFELTKEWPLKLCLRTKLTSCKFSFSSSNFCYFLDVIMTIHVSSNKFSMLFPPDVSRACAWLWVPLVDVTILWDEIERASTIHIFEIRYHTFTCDGKLQVKVMYLSMNLKAASINYKPIKNS